MSETNVNSDKKVALIYSKNHVIHKPPVSSPENPERLIKVMQFLKGRTDVFEKDCEIVSDFEPAGLLDVLKVHDEGYISFVESYCSKGGGFVGDSTYFAPNTFKAALLAAGGAIKACRLVREERNSSAIALIRPPGHHATADKFGGYCIFNNAAIAAKYLQGKMGVDKIMVVDWDAHAGNGTMRIFYDDPTVLTLSIHRDPHEYYPHDGFTHQIGKGRGRGYTVNIEMPECSGDEEYILAFDNVIIPILKQYKPDFVICLNGFDAHFTDDYSYLQVTAKGFYQMTRQIADNTGGNVALLMEGGYGKSNGKLTHTIIEAILGNPLPYEEELDSLSASMMREMKTRTELKEKLKELKSVLSDYWNFD